MCFVRTGAECLSQTCTTQSSRVYVAWTEVGPRTDCGEHLLVVIGESRRLDGARDKGYNVLSCQAWQEKKIMHLFSRMRLMKWVTSREDSTY